MSSSSLIAGRYELGERLGYGGMSTVQVALDRRLERQVAVKLLAEHLADDDQFVTRFRREALSAARLVHPNIVQVFDFGLDEASGRHYIVMEYIRGRSGAEILRDETRLSVEDALELVDGACRGLAHAHRMGVVHRDVKPGNILRSDDGAVKLADFGIAKAMSGATSQITQVGSVLGTAAYLAPEQAAGAEVGPRRRPLRRSASSTYQLLAGRLPYEAESLTELALMQQRADPARLDELDARGAGGARDRRPARAGARPARALRERRGDARRAARRRARRRAGGRRPTATAPTSLLAAEADSTAATRRSRAREAPRRAAPAARAGPAARAARTSRRSTRPCAPAGASSRRRGAAPGARSSSCCWRAWSRPRSRSRSAARGGSGGVTITDVDGSSTSEVVEQMDQLIDDNTR